jgi:hypothetical protein
MLNVLNTVASFSVVLRVAKTPDSYFVHKDLYKTLARIRAREVARAPRGALLAGPREGGKVRFGGSVTPQHTAIADHTRERKAEARERKTVAQGEPEPRNYLAALAESLAVDPEAYTVLTGSAFEAAVLASEQLVALRQSNRLLDHELGGRDEQEHNRFERAFAYLDNSLAPDDDLRRQQLVAASEEIEQSWNVLMLLPNGPYESALTDLVEQLEPDNGEGKLKSDDQALLGIARRMVQDLASNARRTDRDWLSLESRFQALLRGPAQQTAAGDSKRTLN